MKKISVRFGVLRSVNPEVDTVGRTVTQAFIYRAENVKSCLGVACEEPPDRMTCGRRACLSNRVRRWPSRICQLPYQKQSTLTSLSDFNSDHLGCLLSDFNDKTLRSHDTPILLWYLVIIRS
ncbi:hypothetical protein ACTXT7_008878 [Hymenolepis weldensis]